MNHKRAAGITISILLALVAYLVGKRRGYDKATLDMFIRWLKADAYWRLFWHGNGRPDGFEGLTVVGRLEDEDEQH
jgi:hypothetical protein